MLADLLMDVLIIYEQKGSLKEFTKAMRRCHKETIAEHFQIEPSLDLIHEGTVLPSKRLLHRSL